MIHKTYFSKWIGLLFLTLATLSLKAQDTLALQKLAAIDSLNLHFENYEAEETLPGFVVALFNKDEMIYSKGFGYADLPTKKAYDINTVQMIASISKTFVAVALMKAVEDEHLSLDDNINDILPFKVVNPHFPDVPITIRHLATHTSSLYDDAIDNKDYIFESPLKPKEWRPVWHPIIKQYNQNKIIPMVNFLKKTFVLDGEWYSKNNFLKNPPGTYYEYSNFGTGLLAHIIEITTGQDYRAYTKKHILDPIGMDRSGWSRTEVDTINHITYYNDNYFPVPHYTFITYPDGGLYSTVADLTKFLQEMMKGYYGESELLNEASFKEMMSIQSRFLDTHTGLFWDLDQPCCIGHSGNDFGIATMMYFDPTTGIGRIVFSNIDIQQAHQEEMFYTVFGDLWYYNFQQ